MSVSQTPCYPKTYIDGHVFGINSYPCSCKKRPAVNALSTND